MQIKDAKPGDRIKVPITKDTDARFSYDYDGKYIASGSYIEAIIIEEGGTSYTTLIGWSDERPITEYTKFNLSTRPELEKKFPKLKYGISINSDVRCELIVTPKKNSTNSVGFLLACISAGAGLSLMTQNHSQVSSRTQSNSKAN